MKKQSNYYKIQILHMGEVVKEFEFNSYRKAQQIYIYYNNLWDCWTQLYINGQTGNKAWMDRQMHMMWKR